MKLKLRGPRRVGAEGDGSHRFARYTDRARRTLERGQEEARRLGHDFLGTEHLLLGLLAVEDGVGAKVLSGLGVTLEDTRQAVEATVGRGTSTVEGGLCLTPRSKHVLELAAEEADKLLHGYVGTEHLLLGLLREGEGVGGGVLRQRGVTYEAARAQVVAVLKKDNVVTCRVADREIEAIDMLVEAGICSTRSEAASWLIRTGVEASQPLFGKVSVTIAEIRRLRREAQAAAQQR